MIIEKRKKNPVCVNLSLMDFNSILYILSLLQRKTWLREALSEMCKGQLDEVEQMKQCLAVLHKDDMVEKDQDDGDDDDDDDERESAFEVLSELCENLDNARGL